MLPLLAALSLTQANYTSVEIQPFGKTDTWGKVMILDGGLVAGYRYQYVQPGHVGPVLAYPFVWKSGAPTPLPLGNARYGHVRGGNAKLLVGDVCAEDGWLPATWTPDPKDGWSKPALKILSPTPSHADFVHEGAVWTNSDDAIREYDDGVAKEYKLKDQEIVALDDKGVWYVNQTKKGIFGPPDSVKACTWDGKTWKTLQPEGYEMSQIQAVNRQGHAIGTVFKDAWLGAMWDAKGFHLLQGGDRAHANALNDKDELVGCFSKQGNLHACLWDNSGLHDLSQSIDGVTLTEAVDIDNKGQILALSKTHLCLLTPNQRLTSPPHTP